MDQISSSSSDVPSSGICSLCSEKSASFTCSDCPPASRRQCADCSSYLHALKNLQKHDILPLSISSSLSSPGGKSNHTISENARKVNEYVNLGKLSSAFLTAKRYSLNDPDCAAFLALCLHDGHGTPLSSKEALKWARYSSEMKSTFGTAIFLYLQKDYKAALPDLLLFADNGLSSAQRCVGKCYETFSDVAKATDYYQRAVEQAHPSAQNNFGMMHIWGKGVEKDEGMALYYLQLSAEKGHPLAMNNLANQYYRGEGIPKDPALALKYYRLAADANHPFAQNSLGLRYLHGHGVNKNLPLAASYFRLSSEQGEALGTCNLGYCYATGSGVEKNEHKAVELFTLAAEMGDDVAQKNLAKRYEQGRGVEVNLALAHQYYGMSAAQGNSQAIEALERLANS
eukprot:CAMPEP_0201491586 /NCGR_PEP_ID=MMETSP0151_2-20130828/30357_1 /ASSEMBLY_ACC=CAM_ASM_000257 /TAXON_ID=200890 /ORGANISM="Paramoeba atlantica, Strain 621/1 / CCAP 1560/9" /LENGTH=398 /DNA_ID=CAMNT_0047878003 /DNA_START=316 /DNA_END=1509 /DNA_ORIENTATION=+